uniref:Conjugal transfer protein TrbD n=1 Tax=Caulobacter sp. (strain K31) TaxID=366602 RepID=B0T8Q4_CAUSK
MSGDRAAVFVAPVYRALTEPMLLAGAPRAIALVNGTLAAALGLGLRLWLVGVGVWLVGHGLAVWAARHDPMIFDVGRRHVRVPARLEV